MRPLHICSWPWALLSLPCFCVEAERKRKDQHYLNLSLRRAGWGSKRLSPCLPTQSGFTPFQSLHLAFLVMQVPGCSQNLPEAIPCTQLLPVAPLSPTPWEKG